MTINFKSILLGIGRYLMGGVITLLLLGFYFEHLVSRNPNLTSKQEDALFICIIFTFPLLYVWNFWRGGLTSILLLTVLNFAIGGDNSKECITNGTYVYKGSDTKWYVYINGDTWSGQVENILEQPILYLSGRIVNDKLVDEEGKFSGKISCGSIQIKMTDEAKKEYRENTGDFNSMNIILTQE